MNDTAPHHRTDTGRKQIRPVSFIAVLLLVPSLAQAESLQICAAIDDSLERLTCYDALASAERASGATEGNAPVAPDASADVTNSASAPIPDPTPTPAATRPFGGWQLVLNEDDFTNQETTMAILTSDAPGAFGSHAPKELVARCDGDGGHDIFVISHGYIGARRDRVPVRFRFADNDPITEHWHESTSGSAAFLPSGYRDFRRGLRSGDDFIMEISDYRGSGQRAGFYDVDVNADRLEYVLNNCAGDPPA